MKTKNNIRITVFFIIAFIICFTTYSYAEKYSEYSVEQLTNNSYHDGYGSGTLFGPPQIHNGQVVWAGYDGQDSEIFFYNGTNVIQLTNNSYHPDVIFGFDDAHPQIHNGQVTWSGWISWNPQQPKPPDAGQQISLYNGTAIIQLATNLYFNSSPQIHNGQVVWTGSDGDWELFFYNGRSIIQLTDNSYYDWFPQIHNGQIVWSRWDGHADETGEILFYNGTDIIQLTNNIYLDGGPAIHNGQVVWVRWDGNDYEIFLYDGTKTIQLTNNDYDDGGYLGLPQIHDGQVVWAGYDGQDYEIFLYDGTKTIQLTNNSYNDWRPQIDNGQIVWERVGHIFLYDGTNVMKVARISGYSQSPQIHNGQIVWMGPDLIYPYDYEIFLATPPIKIPLGGEIKGTDNAKTYRIYVPSRWGGTLTVKTDTGVVELYYPDALTLAKIAGPDTAITYSIPSEDEIGNPVDNHGWYYVKHSGTTPFTISNTFVEKGEVPEERRPWNISTWWPFSDVIDSGDSLSSNDDNYTIREIETLDDKILPKYDIVCGLIGTNSATYWEKSKSALTDGHYIYNGRTRETKAEFDWRYDWNRVNGIENPGPYDFYSDKEGEGLFYSDGDLSDAYNSTWWGHCNGWANASIIFKDPALLRLKSDFTPEEVKGLLAEIGMRKTEEDTVYQKPNEDEAAWTKKFHDFLRKLVRKEKMAIWGNLKSTTRKAKDVDEVWNHPIWSYEASMKERPTQSGEAGNERLVDVTLSLKAADDLGGDAREDSPNTGRPWKYYLMYDIEGNIAESGSGWDTFAVDDQNTKYHIPFLTHPESIHNVFTGQGDSNPNVTEDRIKNYVVREEIRREKW